MTTAAHIALVALGGGLGAALRALCAGAVARAVGPGLAPLGTLTVNVLGSLAMGALAYLLLRRWAGASPELAALLMTGLLGGFTTFSTFALDMLGLIEAGRALAAAAYAAASVALTVAAAGVGWAVARALVPPL